MPSDLILERLIGAIVTWVADKRSYATKTKLLKLLYLFDMEYYRVHRQTYTGFSWKFFHLGPWAPEYDGVLDNAIARGVIAPKVANTEYDLALLLPNEKIETETLFSSVKDEYILRNVLSCWAPCSTGEILDYVYFRTPPMEEAIRNQPLDFSTISKEKPAVYERTSSGKPKAQVQKLREAFENRERKRKEGRASGFEFTPPRYDDEFMEAMNKVEAN
jgi:hypothetical protein